jgi:hypothetical protein
VGHITGARAQGFPDPDVVVEDLTRGRWYVSRAVKKMFNNAAGKRFQLFI